MREVFEAWISGNEMELYNLKTNGDYLIYGNVLIGTTFSDNEKVVLTIAIQEMSELLDCMKELA